MTHTDETSMQHDSRLAYSIFPSAYLWSVVSWSVAFGYHKLLHILVTSASGCEQEAWKHRYWQYSTCNMELGPPLEALAHAL